MKMKIMKRKNEEKINNRNEIMKENERENNIESE